MAIVIAEEEVDDIGNICFQRRYVHTAEGIL